MQCNAMKKRKKKATCYFFMLFRFVNVTILCCLYINVIAYLSYGWHNMLYYFILAFL